MRPEIIVPKYRTGYVGRIRHDVRIPRYWKSKMTGEVVEVRRLLCVNGEHYQVIYHHPIIDRELSISLQDFRKRYEALGNFSSRY